ncbi:hypothetical protein BDV24DRAFT_126483 [Aspergillus arachidicola]|uniref:Uncharacterized protein n=1 Tax=Aspergillus arachidicola TaxID=656916 RepID=A0A5N6YK46_9EURO|nr:hypothetical protein BDV24DRAFT_126483 [Aspergillus arachidicola]
MAIRMASSRSGHRPDHRLREYPAHRLYRTGSGYNRKNSCLGDDGYEDFYISKIGNDFSFCKTGRRPYDLVVSTILLRAYVLAPSSFELSSDGNWDNDWVEARDLYHCIWPKENIPCPWEKE